MRVEFTSVIASLDVDLRLVDETDDLNVVRSAHELNALQSARRNDSRSMSGLCTPSDLLTLRVRNRRILLRGSPQAEVFGKRSAFFPLIERNDTHTINGVQERRLTVRLLILGGLVALVKTELCSANKASVSVDLVRLIRESYVSRISVHVGEGKLTIAVYS